MKTIMIANEKGGVGKTTASTTLAVGLARRGFAVCLIDADPQGNATQMINQRGDNLLHRWLVEGEDLIGPQLWTGEDRLYLIGGDVSTRDIAAQVDNPLCLREKLADSGFHWDVVVIDTSPTPSDMHSLIYMAADYILLPTQLEPLAMESLGNSLEHLQNAQTIRYEAGMPAIELMGIIPNQYRKSVALHEYHLAELRKRFGELVWNPVAQRVAWAEAIQQRQSIWDYAPRGFAAQEATIMTERAGGYLNVEN